jgi:predicted enzyme related to lactoylglutathione lyase
VLGASVEAGDETHTVLSCAGFELMVQQIPAGLLPAVTPGEPVQRREQSALRLDFPVSDVAHARREAARLGGCVDEQPPSWAGGDRSWFLGQDPEGNVFCLKVR